MKIKFSKKFLSVILAALMVVTSIPIVTISASAADTAALESAITYYESKMDGFSSSNIYKNLLPAYNAYMAAREALKNPDSSDLNTLASNLRTATDSMTQWTKPTYALPTSQMFPGDGGTYYDGMYQNIVYVDQADFFTGGDLNDMRLRVYAPLNVVAVWDGEVKPEYGIAVGQSSRRLNRTRGIGSVYISQANTSSTIYSDLKEVSSEFYYNTNDLETNDFQWVNWAYLNQNGGYGMVPGYARTESDLSSNPSNCKISGRVTGSAFIYVVGSQVISPSFSSSQYSKTYSGTLAYEIQNYDSTLTCWHGVNLANDPKSTYIQVINYAPVLSGINSFAQNIQSALTTNDGIEHYSQGGMTEIFTSLDAYTSDSLNPNNYSYTDVNTGVSQVSTAIGNTVNTYANAKVGNVDNCDIVFNYKDANGQDKTTSYQFRYNTAIAAPADVAQSYVSENGQYTYTFTGWSPEFIATAKGDVTYTAQYSETVNLADFTAYDEVKNALVDQLATVEADHTRQYSVSVLTELDSAIAELSYWSVENRDDVIITDQQLVDSEKTTIDALLETLTNAEIIDTSAAQAAAMNDDPDQYDPEAIARLQEDLITTVEVDGVTYEAVSYANKDELDTAVANALNSAMTYTVYLNGEPVEELIDVPYGAHVIISGDGTVLKSEDAATGGNYSWSGFFAAPSYGESTEEGYNYNTSNERYLTTAPAYSFVVKGDSYLTAVSSSDESLSQVTVKNNVTGFISNIFYVPTNEKIGAELEQSQRNIAGYTFVGFYDSSVGGTLVDADTVVTGDMTVYAQYTARTDQTEYSIWAYNDSHDFSTCEGAIISAPDEFYNPAMYKYNDKIGITTDINDFYAWVRIVDMENYVDNYTAEIVSYDRDYTFYVSQDACVFAITSAEAAKGTLTFNGCDPVLLLNCDGANFSSSTHNAQVFAKKELVPIYNGTDDLEKVSLVGSFAVPEGYEVLEKGFLIDYYNRGIEAADFTVVNDQLSRNKVLHLTAGNQFVLNIIGGGKAPMDYRAYAVVEDAEGNRTEIYSAVTRDAVVG